jgi:hypothetical protein
LINFSNEKTYSSPHERNSILLEANGSLPCCGEWCSGPAIRSGDEMHVKP